MRRAVVLPCLLFWSGAAFAQITTWSPTDKSASITLSNGNLTAQSSATTSFKTIRGTIGKFSGKWCYRFTVTTASGQQSIGFANRAWPVDAFAPLGLLDFGGHPDSSIHSVGLVGPSAWSGGRLNWWTTRGGLPGVTPGGAGITLVRGSTGEMCVDLDQAPPKVWVTPDITATNGAGGGPLWNGLATANPTTGTGPQLAFLPGYTWYPAFNANANDKLTGKFGGFTPPAGFNTWDTAGGEEPIPGPSHPNVVNVANAPEWQATRTYGLKDRVLAGPAWSGGAYTNGQDLCLWAVKFGGTSGSSVRAFDTACSTGTPANVGGGLDGTIPAGWAGATSVTEGGVTWTLLTKVDYTTLTASMVDDPVSWTPNTTYTMGAAVVFQGASYLNQVSKPCTSGSVGLTASPDGTCTSWYFFGTIPYVSTVPKYPHILTTIEHSYNAIAPQYFDEHVRLWYGGAQRTHYGAGEHGESVPMPLTNHRWPALSQTESASFCYKNDALIPLGAASEYNCNSNTGGAFQAIIQPAPGDSFADHPSLHLRYDESQGVALWTAGTDHETHGGWYWHDAPLDDADPATLTRLQLKSEHGTGVALAGADFYHNIVESGGAMGVMGCCPHNIHDNVVIMNSSTPGNMAFAFKYLAPVYNNTAISLGAANSTFFNTFDASGVGFWSKANPAPVSNNLFFGFQVPGSTAHGQGGGPIVWNNLGNASDVPNSFPVTSSYSTMERYLYGVQIMFPQDFAGLGNTCGAGNNSPCTGLSAADVFVNPTIGPNLDLRLKPGSPVLGAGANFSVHYTHPTNDIFGTPRPQGSRYDAGAFEFK
jgi:hypothetical protein